MRSRIIAKTRVRTTDKKRVNPVKYTFRCALRSVKHVISNPSLGWPSNGHDHRAHSPAFVVDSKIYSLEFLCGVICLRANILKPLTTALCGLCFCNSALHPLQRIDEQDRNEYERYLERIGNLGDNRRVGEPVEQGLANFVGEG